MKKIISISILLFFLVFNVLGGIKFTYEILKNPIVNYSDIEAGFKFSEIDKYSIDSNENNLFLENGYAQFALKNANEWLSLRNSVKVERISIIYTKYPLRNEDWITNYYDLLANRILELLKYDSLLNSNKFEWHLVAQTDCKTGEEAEEFLHGIEIKYSFKKVDNTNQKTNDIIVPLNNKKYDKYKTYERDNSFFEHQKLMEEEKKLFQKKEKKKKTKEPECPDFSKKRFRLFKRRSN